jgi:hypothetical protein
VARGPYCLPTWPSQCVWKAVWVGAAGWSGWWVQGVGLHQRQRPHAARGALLPSPIRVPKKNARCPGRAALYRKAWPGWLSYALSPGGAGGEKPLRYDWNPKV